RSFIQRIRMMVDVTPFKRRADRSAKQGVLINLGDCVKAGMKVRVGLDDVEDSNRRGEQAVDGALQIGRGDGIFDRERGDLGPRMDACIGTSGSRDMNGPALHAADNLFERSLDGGKPRLDLPAV